MTLDLNYVRAQFPGLSDNYAYLDNAGGSQVLAGVAGKISDYLLTSSVQLGASYRKSMEAREKVLAARRSIARLINAPHDEEVVMGGSTTLLLQLLCRAIEPGIGPDDEIIVTDSDHEANIGPWVRLERLGARIRWWTVNKDSLDLELADLDKLITPRTRWIAMTHASNVLGTINPVEAVARKAHAVGARLCVDAVAYAPHRLVDVQASGADAYVFSFYKVFGPHFAVLWLPREQFLELPSLNHYFVGRDVLPYKLQPGNVNYELSWGCTGICDYLVEVGRRLGANGDERQCMAAAFAAFETQEDAIAERLLGYLRGRRDVRIIGTPRVEQRRRVPTVSFVAPGRGSADIVAKVDGHDIGIRYGDFYARRLIEGLGLTTCGGVVRVSMAHYNTLDEIDRLIRALDTGLS
jgi:cysteine desulfurase family protein (TIGR01976 family)